MQALELVSLDPAGVLDHARHRERIVGRKLRIEPPARGDQLARTDRVAQIGHGLAGEHGIVGEPAFLGALDLRVPIGALHQPYRQPAAERARGIVQPIDHRRGALLIGLNRQSEAFPAAQRLVRQHRRDHVDGELEPVGFLGVDGEIEIMTACRAGKLGQLRHQLG